MTKPEPPPTLLKDIEKARIFADYFQIYLRDDNTDVGVDEMWSLFNPMDKMVTKPGFVSIGTVRPFEVDFGLELHSEEPDAAKKDKWAEADHVTECVSVFPSGTMFVMGCADIIKGRITGTVDVDPTQSYRIRVLCRNLDKIAINGMQGQDSYHVYMWPVDEDESPPVIHKRHMVKKWKDQVHTRLAYYVNPPCGPALFDGIAFIRHGPTARAHEKSKEADLARKLSDAGRVVCAQAGSGWYKTSLAGKSTFAVCSTAQRCLETCKVMGEKSGKMPVVKEANYLYEGTREQRCDDLFNEIGYKPLAEYFAAPNGKEAFRNYAEKAWSEVLDVISNSRELLPEDPSILKEADKVKLQKQQEEDFIVPVFSHAVHSAAMAYFMASAIGLGDEAKQKIVDFNQGEAECIWITRDDVQFFTNQ